MIKQKHLATAALLACFFAVMVISLGAFTRLIDAGLGCPDWPGCYGHLLAPLSNTAQAQVALQYPHASLDVYKAWAEMVHRYFAGTLGCMIFVVLFLLFSKPLRNRVNSILGCGLILLLTYQILLGQWTVTYKLLPIVVTQHLLGGFLILTTLWLVYLNNSARQPSQATPHPVAGIFAVIGLILVFLQIMLGAWTSTNYASFSCPDFPFCTNGDYWMTMHFKEAFNLISPIGVNYEGGVLPESVRQTIQMTHRLGALILTIYLFILSAVFMKCLRPSPELYKSIYLVWGLLFIQLCLGMINVIFKLPLASAIAHNLLAVMLLLAMVTLVFKLFASRKV